MDDLSNRSEQVRRADAMEFLRTELATALVFAALAERHRKSGQHEAAGGAVVYAENSFEELARFLYDSKNTEYVTALERVELKHEIRRLRTKLDSVKAL